MKIKCTKDEEHKNFEVTAHVSQRWVVDDVGECVDILEGCGEVVHYPDPEDIYLCSICGAEAEATT